MPYIKLKNKKFQVAKDIAFVTLLNGCLPLEESIQTLFNRLDDLVRFREPSISREALANVHGDWYEWILAITAWNDFIDQKVQHLAILLPNVNQFNVTSLYVNELSFLIEDFRQKVFQVSGVRLITSNPDFVIIQGDLAHQIIGNKGRIDIFSIKDLGELELRYKLFIGKCKFEEIIGYASIKASLRPDRRLQISHEGSLMKALYAHLQTRQWRINPPGLKYYAITTKVNEADREALRTIATHSIPTVSNMPEAAVDEVFEVNSIQQAQTVFQSILN